MDFVYNDKTYNIDVKHMSEYYDEYIKTKNINIFKFYLEIDGVWRRTELMWLYEYLIKEEEYEKCVVIKKLIDSKYVGDLETQNNLNIKLQEFENKKNKEI